MARIEAGAVARIEVSEHDGNAGRIVDVVGRVGRFCLVWDGLPFNGYEQGQTADIPIEDRVRVEHTVLGIEEWKLRRVY